MFTLFWLKKYLILYVLSYLNHTISGIGMALAWHEIVTSSPSSTRTSFSVAMKDGGSPSTVRRVVLFEV